MAFLHGIKSSSLFYSQQFAPWFWRGEHGAFPGGQFRLLFFLFRITYISYPRRNWPSIKASCVWAIRENGRSRSEAKSLTPCNPLCATHLPIHIIQFSMQNAWPFSHFKTSDFRSRTYDFFFSLSVYLWKQFFPFLRKTFVLFATLNLTRSVFELKFPNARAISFPPNYERESTRKDI